MSDRASVPAVATATLLAATILLGAAVCAATLETVPEGPQPSAALSLSASESRLSLVHRGGDALDVRTLRLRVRVDGVLLARQPPVPFFSARGFVSGPTGPFNAASDPTWTAGETATLRVAGTNDPPIRPGARVTVRIYRGDRPLAALSATVRSGTG
ncbi:type IV pilin [Halegenticoccus soli]|uniref:type IV pilin n=1 Tax=Halegenticoccus soli TaxID=1985678 RepID=UPI000C6E8AE2|nr:type IV pilin [Halegenticoccus soli]